MSGVKGREFNFRQPDRVWPNETHFANWRNVCTGETSVPTAVQQLPQKHLAKPLRSLALLLQSNMAIGVRRDGIRGVSKQLLYDLQVSSRRRATPTTASSQSHTSAPTCDRCEPVVTMIDFFGLIMDPLC